jgi:hypothetical protein
MFSLICGIQGKNERKKGIVRKREWIYGDGVGIREDKGGLISPKYITCTYKNIGMNSIILYKTKNVRA